MRYEEGRPRSDGPSEGPSALSVGVGETVLAFIPHPRGVVLRASGWSFDAREVALLHFDAVAHVTEYACSAGEGAMGSLRVTVDCGARVPTVSASHPGLPGGTRVVQISHEQQDRINALLQAASRARGVRELVSAGSA